mgnify:CR=1 FL=1
MNHENLNINFYPQYRHAVVTDVAISVNHKLGFLVVEKFDFTAIKQNARDFKVSPFYAVDGL